jgi:signal transduction histidine kinase
MSRVRSFLFSLQTKLVLAMTAVIVLAIFLAGAVFVARNRDERRQQALDRVAAASPAVYQQALYALVNDGGEGGGFAAQVDELAKEQDLRILVIATDGTVLHDTEDDRLQGGSIVPPRASVEDARRGYVSWQPDDSFPEKNLTLISGSTRFLANGRPLPFSIVLAVKTDTIASAWLGVLPGLGLAALVAIPLASLAAILLARQVSQPLRKLSEASEALAGGDFDQRVEVDRDDEVGQLARSFSVMAERIGQRDAQMRTLLANVSHDLKTPMTSITGYAQALTDGTADPADAARIGTVIREESDHVNRLLGDLLYLAELDAGQVLNRREDVPLEDVVARCVRRIEPAARARGLSVDVDVAAEAVLRGIDPDKLERALTNVLDNAAKFSPPGGEIEVHGWRENGVAPARVLCSVTNAGAPIPDDDLPRLFDRFFRGDRARRSASGSGLGLAIARELIELNHGSIAAANEPAGRVRFTVSLPG